MQKGFVPIIILVGLVILLIILFVPLPYYERGGCTLIAPRGKCIPAGWRLGRPFYKRFFAETPVSKTVSPKPTSSDEICQDSSTKAKLLFSEAMTIAKTSECGKSGQFKENHFCNENSGIWWIDLNMNEPKEGCNPACVIDANTKKAEINWRCTGLLPSK